MSTVHVLAIITAKAGMRDQILAAFRANVPAVHAEEGCIEYGATVDADALSARGLIRGAGGPVKLLAEGEAPKNLVVKLARVSASAKAKIEAAGGTVELV